MWDNDVHNIQGRVIFSPSGKPVRLLESYWRNHHLLVSCGATYIGNHLIWYFDGGMDLLT